MVEGSKKNLPGGQKKFNKFWSGLVSGSEICKNISLMENYMILQLKVMIRFVQEMDYNAFLDSKFQKCR